MSKYAVQAATLSPAIHVGEVAPSGQAFSHKEEHTDMVLAAVAMYVMEHFADPEHADRAGMATTFPRLGLSVEFKVDRVPVEGA